MIRSFLITLPFLQIKFLTANILTVQKVTVFSQLWLNLSTKW